MKEVIEQLINDKFYTDNGTLDFSCSSIEISLKKNEIPEEVFQIYYEGKIPLKGVVTTCDLRIRLRKKEISNECKEVRFFYDSTGLEEGEIIKSSIILITNMGEYEIPVLVTVEQGYLKSSLGNIKNLFHFANLAKSNWMEAVQLFYSKEFHRIFVSNDKQHYPTYLGLSQAKGNQKNVNEFLVMINKKQKIEYFVEKQQYLFENPSGITEDTIKLTKNGWGYVDLQVEVQGDFLFVDKEFISDQDFLGNHCFINFHVDQDKLHIGKNFGKIMITNISHTFEIHVTATWEWTERVHMKKRQQLERMNLELIKAFVLFRGQKISMSEWLKQTGKIVEQFGDYYFDFPGFRLYQAHYLIGEERVNEAKWILDHMDAELSKGEFHPDFMCYYLFLTTLLNKELEYVNNVTSEVKKIYGNYPTSWRVAWIYLYLEEEFARSASSKWLFLEEVFERGCSSPVIYVEALQLIKTNPTLLRKLDGFELQILYFAAKNQLLDIDLIHQIHYLMGKIKVFHPLLLKLLEACYEIKPEQETLTGICSLLKSGNKIGTQYFPWYERAVLMNLRITKLYEYYINSIDLNFHGELPRMVVLYFAYQSDLSYEVKAFLYSNILMHEDKYHDISLHYQMEMEKFVLEQIQLGHINDKLAYLYKQLITSAMLNKEIANKLTNLLFVHKIQVFQSDIRRVVILHSKTEQELSYPVIHQMAYVPIYSSDYSIFLEDAKQNRYGQTLDFQIEKLIGQSKLFAMVHPFVQDQLGYDLYLCEGARTGISITRENCERFLRILKSSKITNEYKKEIRLRLVQFYYENDMIQELDEYLLSIETKKLDSRERGELIQYLVNRGMHEVALRWIREYGLEGVQVKSLLRLCGRLLSRDSLSFDQDLVLICYSAFKGGKYDEYILTYLCQYYDGLTKELRDIWKAAKDFGMNLHTISERIVVQMLFSGAYVGEKASIFEGYKKTGSSPKITLAYLCQNAYEYFILDRVVDDSIFLDMEYLYQREDTLNLICKLAYLKFFAENKKLRTGNTITISREFVRDILKQHMVFPFLKEYMDFVNELSFLADKTMIEYKTKPESKVVIHYVLEKEEGPHEYLKEEMQNMYGGIYVKSFVLFFGESLQYYITEECERKEQLTESGTISKSDLGFSTKESRFNLLNDLVISKTLQDYETFDKILEEFLRNDFLVQKLFKIV